MEKNVLRQISEYSGHNHIIDLVHVAKILHFEQGLFPSRKRAYDIQDFFDVQQNLAHLDYKSDKSQSITIGGIVA